MKWITWNFSDFSVERGWNWNRKVKTKGGVLRETENDRGGEKGSQTKRELHTYQNISNTLWLFNFFLSLRCCQESAPWGPKRERVKSRQREKVRGRVFLLSDSAWDHRDNITPFALDNDGRLSLTRTKSLCAHTYHSCWVGEHSSTNG